MQVRIVELELGYCCVASFVLTSVGAGVPAGSNDGDYGSPSLERLVYLTTCLIGHRVEVQVTDGSVYSGIFHTTNAEKDFGMF